MYIRITMSIVSVLLAGALLSGCKPAGQLTGNSNRVEKPEIVNQRTSVLEQAQQKREARTKELKAMDVPRLAEELAKESNKGVEPFNSMTFTEMVSRGPSGADALAPLITKPDRSSLLSLLALRKMSKERYQQLKPELRVSVLTNALKTGAYFNTFGLPHATWEDAAKAIIEEGSVGQRRSGRYSPPWSNTQNA